MPRMTSLLSSQYPEARRAEIFSQLSQIEEHKLEDLQKMSSGEYYDGEDYSNEQFVEDMNVSDAIGTSLQSCQESYIEHSGNMLVQGETVLKQTEYEKSMQVVDRAAGGWSSQMETVLLELEDLYHIQEDVVADSGRELALLDNELLALGENKYLQILSQGAGGAYQAAVANGVSQAARNQVLEDRKAVANGAKSEFQYLIQAKTKRQSAAEAVDYTYSRIEKAEGFYDRRAGDDFRAKAGETIDDHILWLQNLARSISGEEEGLQSELSKLESRKEELLEQQADALDNNDLSTARKYEVLAAQVEEEIGAKEQELQAVLTSADSTASQKAQAMNGAGNTTTLNNINQMKNSALSMIANGNISGNDNLGNMIDGLALLGAESALAEIRDKAAQAGSSQLLKDIDRAIEDSRDIKGVLVLLNTMGGDVEAGLAIAEMIASISKPTVSLVLGGSHSIGVPIAVSTDYSYIVPTGTMVIHPVRMSGMVIGVPQTFDYFKLIQDRITGFVCSHCKAGKETLERLMMETGVLTKDVGTILVGEDAVKYGIIDEVGGIDKAIARLHEMIQKRGSEEADQ